MAVGKSSVPRVMGRASRWDGCGGSSPGASRRSQSCQCVHLRPPTQRGCMPPCCLSHPDCGSCCKSHGTQQSEGHSSMVKSVQKPAQPQKQPEKLVGEASGAHLGPPPGGGGRREGERPGGQRSGHCLGTSKGGWAEGRWSGRTHGSMYSAATVQDQENPTVAGGTGRRADEDLSAMRTKVLKE